MNTNSIDISKMSAFQLEELTRQIKEREKSEKLLKAQLQKDYNALKEVQVNETFKALSALSAQLEQQKTDIYKQFSSLLDMKQELYALTDDQMEEQQSHTFTTADGKISIIIGSNVVDGWTDEVGVGIGKVMAWADKIAGDDPKTMQLVSYIKGLLKTDKNGILKANRVLDMSKQANEFGDQELIEAVDFIRDQYRPVKTKTFIKAKFVDEHGDTQWLPLSISAI